MELPLELPDDVLRLVKEYSMPVTRPDWRKLHKMTFAKYLLDYNAEFNKRMEHIYESQMRVYSGYNPYLYKPVFSGTNYHRMFGWALFS